MIGIEMKGKMTGKGKLTKGREKILRNENKRKYKTKKTKEKRNQ